MYTHIHTYIYYRGLNEDRGSVAVHAEPTCARNSSCVRCEV